ncbi:helix-turn-helix domain-containing protein [Levilactobacillus tujiorum]|uniref:helix-turn-helix domain-containing protein n=1 Tax=Levilactobacillus tujiorum TaxID=2912243 RepID=UPI0014567BC2|nr:hypothetical protein [Levilactobacillus tujiorum]
MAAKIVFIERERPQAGHLVYIVGYPICEPDVTGQLVPASSMVSWGEITQIKRDDHQRFVIESTSGNSITLGAKKVVNFGVEMAESSVTDVLTQSGYSLSTTVTTPVSDVFKRQLAAVFPQVSQLQAIPERYAVIDCEFGILFGRKQQGDNIVQQQVSILGEKASIFQLAALGYAGRQPIELFFNHYLSHPNFLADLKLKGLRATRLTLADYERETHPVLVLKEFIQHVLARQLPLVFWDQHNDLRLLRQLLAIHLSEFSAEEQSILRQPLMVFDGSAYTNLVINRSNHARRETSHYLPLNGVAGLLNIFNPQQHNALWDAQTTHYVVNALAEIQQTQPIILTQPQPVAQKIEPERTEALDPTTPAPTATVFCELRSAGKTYREIAQTFGISTSTVWRAVHQATGA